METSLISDFAILSIVMGLMAGFGTLSAIRGVFTFLVFVGFTLTQLLGALRVHETVSFFLGQLIVMVPTYLFIKNVYPEILVKTKQEFQRGSSKCH
ncbi:MAG: hypothetical protein V3S16_13340 [Candidatus Desulfatibia sp.]|uniref:hypothetical protein n=1 Tax=Candidatus Desulfatibia sp. TaxID=3101189 RepID=UPI002F2E5EFA